MKGCKDDIEKLSCQNSHSIKNFTTANKMFCTCRYLKYSQYDPRLVSATLALWQLTQSFKLSCSSHKHLNNKANSSIFSFFKCFYSHFYSNSSLGPVQVLSAASAEGKWFIIWSTFIACLLIALIFTERSHCPLGQPDPEVVFMQPHLASFLAILFRLLNIIVFFSA